MNRSTILIFVGSLMMFGTFFLAKQILAPFMLSIPMTSPTTATCSFDPVQASLRIWLDTIPRSPAGSGALPPGIEAPVQETPGPETHALNLELTLVNASQNQQEVQVVGWSWSQGNQTYSETWDVAPDMSPLNQYSQVQRQLVQLSTHQAVKAVVDLDINGQPCSLQVQVEP